MTFTKQEVKEIQNKFSETVDFDIDKKNLLKDVISKQTGSLNKAIKELFQNSFDAEAKEIDVILSRKSLRFIDNGCGMNKQEIHDFFRVFGRTVKRNNKEKIGAFGMGRGQVFNFGLITWKTQNYVMKVDIQKALSYVLEEVDDYINGTDITIDFYDEIYSWDVSNTIFHIKKDILPPPGVIIRLNKESYHPVIDIYEDFSNEKYFVFTSREHVSTIFNGYLAVKHINYSNYKYSVMPYDKLELNFARNELLETSQSTKDLLKFIYKIEEAMASEKNRFNYSEALIVLSLLATKKITLESVYDKKIVPLSNEKLVSFKEIIEEPNMGILFGGKNIWSDDCLRQDYKVISSSVTGKITRIKDNFNLTELEFLDETVKELSKRGFHREVGLPDLKRNLQYYYMAKELNNYVFERLAGNNFLNNLRDIKLGISDVASGWTDGFSYIWINRLNIEGYKNKEEALVELWHILCHEYAHTDENTKEDHHNYEFYENFEIIVRKSLHYLPYCMKYITRKFLKEKYVF